MGVCVPYLLHVQRLQQLGGVGVVEWPACGTHNLMQEEDDGEGVHVACGDPQGEVEQGHAQAADADDLPLVQCSAWGASE